MLTSVKFVALSTHEQFSAAFVSAIISLEALLLGEHEAITNNLAERVAFILGKDSDERNEYYDLMMRLYQIRSRIVHSGNTDMQLSDLECLQRMSYGCITNLLKSYKPLKINNTKDFIRWIRKEKFT